MEILKDLTDEQVREIADRPTPEPMAGEWVLMAPNGQRWFADSPRACLLAEQKSRIPPLVALARIRRALLLDESTPKET